MTGRIILLALAATIGLACPASAQDAVQKDAPQGAAAFHPDPDWPCVQRKVPELSAAAIWSGPPLDTALDAWLDNEAVAALVRELAARRLPLEEATAAVASFAGGLSDTTKEEQLLLLFAGLFQTLDRERASIMAGIERYARRQKAMAEEIRTARERLSDLGSAGGDPNQISALTDQLLWETRIFNERQQSLTYVCEVPTIIEQRLFALGRAIQNALPAG